ncbi:MAG: NUDIX domain-containing protein [Pseudomonadota bacterium]
MRTPRRAWRPKQHIRPLALGVVWRGDEVLLCRVFDDEGNTEGWRPLGGGIDFGERAEAAVRREFLEEIGEEIVSPTLLGVLESHYEHYGMTGHEIVFVFDARFMREEAYDTESWAYEEEAYDGAAEWVHTGLLRSGSEALFPDGLLALLTERRQG